MNDRMITFIDVLDAGACIKGVAGWVLEYGAISCPAEQLAAIMNKEELRISGLEGEGDGEGDGDGYGYGGGYGYGYGGGYGYGDVNGYGYGNGDGYGYGYSNGYGNGELFGEKEE